MSIIIRQAKKNDARQVAPLILEAIGDIAKRLTGENETKQIIEQLEILFQREDNRHSYLNTYVAFSNEDYNTVIGILVLYSGADGLKMDVSLQKWLKQKGAPSIEIDCEAHLDEYYIDTICVHPNSRGLGIGTKLLQFAEEVSKQKGYSKLSLNVEVEKHAAQRLYERMGYKITEPWTIIDEPFHHMVKIIL